MSLCDDAGVSIFNHVQRDACWRPGHCWSLDSNGHGEMQRHTPAASSTTSQKQGAAAHRRRPGSHLRPACMARTTCRCAEAHHHACSGLASVPAWYTRMVH